MVAACCLVALGASVAEAVEVVRRVRPGAIETRAQELCVHAFDERWRTHLVRKAEAGTGAQSPPPHRTCQ